MAEIIERKKKDGTFSYMIRVYSGRTRDDKVITKCKTVTPPTGMGKKKTEKWVQEQAILFEQKVTNGLVLDSDVLLDALSDAPPQYSLIVQLALLIGARRGEICALRWSDIDLEKGTISINRTVQFIPGTGLVFNPPKTKRSRRCIKMGADCVQLLQEYRKHQKAERFKIGSEWVRKVEIEGKMVENDLLFTKWNGAPIDPKTVTTWFPGFLATHDLPPVHFHSLRHTNASILIAAHTPITTVSGRLGHAQTSTTLNHYASAIQSADAAAADTLEGIIKVRERKQA